jgi:tetratricopeptide (TPR) repeat protein
MLRQNRAINAADLFEQALLLFEATPQADEVLKGHLLNGLGLAQHHKGSQEEAEYTFGQALALAKRVTDAPQLEQEARYGLGLVYIKQHKMALASDNLRQALVYTRQRQDRRGEAMILIELGSSYVEQSILNRAIACLLMAQRLYTMVELFTDYEERKQAERRLESRLQEVRKRVKQVNIHLGEQQYQSWVADFEAGKLLPE